MGLAFLIAGSGYVITLGIAGIFWQLPPGPEIELVSLEELAPELFNQD